MCHKAIDIAKLIIAKTDVDKGDLITNLKLQKLLYYVQGFYLAFYNKPLFSEKIVAWQYGPVVVEVYDHFKKYESGIIPVDTQCEDILTEKEQNVLDQMYRIYSQYSASKLVDMTHSESPWKETPISRIISHEKLKKYFKTRIE